jgi:hypothetical protein
MTRATRPDVDETVEFSLCVPVKHLSQMNGVLPDGAPLEEEITNGRNLLRVHRGGGRAGAPCLASMLQ